MILVVENKAGLKQDSPYESGGIRRDSASGGGSGSCFYDYGAPKRASFSYYEKGGKSNFIESIKRREKAISN